MKDHYDYLIIGADAAGNSAVGQIRRNDKSGSIGIIEMGHVIAYGACGLPYAVSRKIEKFDSLIHFSPDGFAGKNNAEIFTGTQAVDLNLSEQKVKIRNLQDGSEGEVGYGKLMIATGANPIRLPFIDYSSERVFELKSVPDGQRIQKFIDDHSPKKAAIIGSGYIGLETAETFRELGLDVDIYEALDRPVPRMPKFIGDSVVKQMKAQGIGFFPQESVQEVNTTGDKVTVKTANRVEEYDMLLSAIGVKPATDFAQSSGLKLEKGAVVVDAAGRTSDPHVWSGGDCALVHHHLLKRAVYFPLGHTANKQGRIAGVNMSGGDIALPGIVGTQVFKFFDTMYAQTGITKEEAEQEGYNPTEVSAQRMSRAGYYPGAEKVKLSLVIDQDSHAILGAAMAGAHDSYGLIDTAAAMVYTGMSADEAQWFDMAYAPPYAPVWNALVSAAGKFSS